METGLSPKASLTASEELAQNGRPAAAEFDSEGHVDLVEGQDALVFYAGRGRWHVRPRLPVWRVRQHWLLLRNSRKTGAPRRSCSAEFLSCMAARESAPFALLRNSRKTGAPRRFSSAEFLSCTAARESAPFALGAGRFHESRSDGLCRREWFRDCGWSHHQRQCGHTAAPCGPRCVSLTYPAPVLGWTRWRPAASPRPSR
jgi:hypothetical protein